MSLSSRNNPRNWLNHGKNHHRSLRLSHSTPISTTSRPHLPSKHLPGFHSLAVSVKGDMTKTRGVCSQTALDSLPLFKECCWKPLCLGSRKKFKPLRQPPKPSRTSQPGQGGSCPFSGGQAQLCSLSWNAPKNNSECHQETRASAGRQPSCTTNKRCQGLIYSLHGWGVKLQPREALASLNNTR